MQAYKNTRKSDMYAPYGKCPACGWSGRDWGFKYRNLCKRCHTQWRKEQAEERRKNKLPNTTVEITEGIVVTEHVHNRLRLKAKRKVGDTASYWLARFIPVIAVVGTMHLIDSVKENGNSDQTIFGIMFGGLFLAVASYCIFNSVWVRKIEEKTANLANDRQQKIQEQQRFYASSEWRLVREQVIQEQGHVCQECRRRITTDYDLTVDHIKPRSKFPELALDKSNLQVLCRRCNSAKGVTYNEASITNQVTASF